MSFWKRLFGKREEADRSATDGGGTAVRDKFSGEDELPPPIPVSEADKARSEGLHKRASAAITEGWEAELRLHKEVLKVNPMHFGSWMELAHSARAAGDMRLNELCATARDNIQAGGGPPNEAFRHLGIPVPNRR